MKDLVKGPNHPKRNPSQHMKMSLFITACLVCASLAHAGNTYYGISVSAVSSDPFNSSEVDTILVGSGQTILLTLNPSEGEIDLDQEYHGLPQECPKWLQIEFAELQPNGEFAPLSTIEIQPPKLDYFNDWYDMLCDSMFRAGHENYQREKLRLLYPDYKFYFEVPQELAGKTIRIIPRFDPLPYGPIATGYFGEQLEDLVYVKQPQTKNDSIRVFIFKANNLLRAQRFEECLMTADSGMAYGFIELADQGKSAASRSQNWEKAISYLDTLYNSFEKVALSGIASRGSQAEQADLYKKERTYFLEKLDQEKPASPK